TTRHSPVQMFSRVLNLTLVARLIPFPPRTPARQRIAEHSLSRNQEGLGTNFAVLSLREEQAWRHRLEWHRNTGHLSQRLGQLTHPRASQKHDKHPSSKDQGTGSTSDPSYCLLNVRKGRAQLVARVPSAWWSGLGLSETSRTFRRRETMSIAVAAPHSASRPAAPPQAETPRHVLLVEDHEPTGQQLVKLLEKDSR